MPKELRGRWVTLFCGDLFATLLLPYLAIEIIRDAWPLETSPSFYQTALLLAGSWLAAIYFEDLYALDTPRLKSEVLVKLLSAGVVGSLAFMVIALSSQRVDFDIGFIVIYGVAAGVGLTFWRLALAVHEVGLVVVGTGECAMDIANEVKHRQHLGYRFLGFLDREDGASSEGPQQVPVIRVTSLSDVPLRKAIEVVVVSCRAKDSFAPEELLQWRLAGTQVIDCDTFYERLTGRLPVARVQDSWLAFAPGFKRSKIALATKRVFDLVAAFAILIGTLPVTLLTSIAIKFESPGPIFYSQERSGMAGRTFWIYKFRSMRTDAERTSGPVWAEVDDPRVTRVGRIIRRFRIDELPQLVNVLKGDMSLVGPRPERPEMTAELEHLIPHYRCRLSVKAGITGWAQICYPYGASIDDAREKSCFDLYYVKNWSVALDLQIMLQSVKVVLFGRGAR